MIEFIGHIIKELSLGSFVSAWVMIGSVKVLDCYDRYCSEQVKWMSGWVGCDGD